jgi:hypothetical protein
MNGAEGNAGSIPLAAMRGVSAAQALEPASLRYTGRIAVGQAMVPLLILAWLGLGIPAQFSSRAAPAEEAAASPAASYTADLNHQETDEVLISRPVGIRLQTGPFQKEPALPGQSVFRGSLLWGQRTEQAMPFVWDKGRGRLLLDLNRNRDLTDDPKSVFVSASRDNNQFFTNIHLALPAGTGDRTVRLQLQFNSYQDGSVNAYAGLCSYWQAKVSLRGTEWQFGLVESLLEDKASAAPLYLLLRPWTERQRPFNLATSTPDFCWYTTNVFFGNGAYGLDYRCYGRGESAKYQVTFKEQAPRLGELNVTGADLHRLILTTGRGQTVLLDQPQGTVKLPVGSYSLDEIWLRQGEIEVLRLNAGRVTLDEQHPATLLAGGPLTNSVDVRSLADSLQLSYQLLGADGGVYKFPRPDYQHPPEFAVFQGTNRLATGKFQYG